MKTCLRLENEFRDLQGYFYILIVYNVWEHRKIKIIDPTVSIKLPFESHNHVYHQQGIK